MSSVLEAVESLNAPWLAAGTGVAWPAGAVPLWAVVVSVVVTGAIVAGLSVLWCRRQAQPYRRQMAEATDRIRWLQSLIDSSESAIIGIDPNGRISSTNAAAASLLGTTAGELVGRAVGDIEAEGHRHGFEELLHEVMSGSPVGRLETVWQRRSGPAIDITMTCSAVKDPEGRILGAAIIAHDVSAQKDYELALRRTRDLLSAVLNASAAGIMAFEAVRDDGGQVVDFRWSMVNPAAERLVGRAADELIGARLLDVFPGNRVDGLFDRYVAVVESGRPDSFIHRYRHEGLDAWFQIDIVGLGDGFTVLFGDVTHTVLAEAENRQLATAVRHSRDAITVRDLDDRILSWNEGATQMYGFVEDEALDQPFTRLLLPESTESPETPRLIGLMNGSTRLDRYETTRRTKDGRTIDVWITASLLVDDAGEPYALTTIERDVTSQKEGERALHEAFRNLAERNTELRQFASVASHDLQEPLRMISSYVQLLERKYGEQLDSQAVSYIRFARDGAQRMGQLIRDLLRYSEMGSQTPQLSRTSLAEVVADAASNLDEADGRDAKLVVEVTSPLPEVDADPIQLRQVFQNLLSNAVKFRRETPARVEISARKVEEGVAWQIDVRDNGIGIEARYGEQIFMPFKRLHSRQTYSGTGIGLAICRRIVDRHGGRIWVDSTPGSGSVFSFTLPAIGAMRPAPRVNDPG